MKRLEEGVFAPDTANSLDNLSSLERVRKYQRAQNPNTELAMKRLVDRIYKAGYPLPCTATQACTYLVNMEDKAKVDTLRNYASLIVMWHKRHGFDELAAAISYETGEMLSGMALERTEPAKPARALHLTEFAQIDRYLTRIISEGDSGERMKAMFDQALLRVLFWTGRRESEICGLTMATCELVETKTRTEVRRTIDMYWGQSKGDKLSKGVKKSFLALPMSDPWQALYDWITINDLQEGPIFRTVKRNGHLRASAMHPNSVPPWIKSLARKSGLPFDDYSGHSFRRGLANMLGDELSLPNLMDYFGWKDEKTAARYVIGSGNFEIDRKLVSASMAISALLTNERI